VSTALKLLIVVGFHSVNDKLKHVEHQMVIIFHITKREEWEKAQHEGVYRTASLATEGFIHCSRADQVIRTANRIFSGQTGLVLLEIDTKVTPEIRYENCEDGEEQFPHIYGPLGLESVVRVLAFEPKEDGSFVMPPG
jgi:uncharacterized protein (DUF952 family)